MFVLPISIASSISSHPYAKRNHYTVFCVKARATFRGRGRPCRRRARGPARAGRGGAPAAPRGAPLTEPPPLWYTSDNESRKLTEETP